MNLTQFTITITPSDKEKFEADTPQSVNVNGINYIREDVVQAILKQRFENSEN